MSTKPATTETAAYTAPEGTQPVVVCTERRGVFFGYTADPLADPMTLHGSRMCLYWSAKTGGVNGLAERGPADAGKNNGSRISARADVILKQITAVFPANAAAADAWNSAPVQGR